MLRGCRWILTFLFHPIFTLRFRELKANGIVPSLTAHIKHRKIQESSPSSLCSRSFSPFSCQGDWCHSNRLTSCSSRCCSRCLASRRRRPSSAETGSLRVWKRSWGRPAAARGAAPSSWATPAPARPPSCGGWWRSALTAHTHRRRAPVRPNVSIPWLHAAFCATPYPRSLLQTAISGFCWIGRKRKITVLVVQPVTRLHTHLSSPPQWFHCWLQLCKRTKSVFFFCAAVGLLPGKQWNNSEYLVLSLDDYLSTEGQLKVFLMPPQTLNLSAFYCFFLNLHQELLLFYYCAITVLLFRLLRSEIIICLIP